MIGITEYDITAGTTSKSIAMPIHEETDGTNTNDDRAQVSMANANITECKYWRQGGTVTTITTADHTNLNDAYSSGKFKEAGVGWYRLDLPDAALAAGADWVIVWIKTDTKLGKGTVKINLSGQNVTAIDNQALFSHFAGTFPTDNRKWLGNTIPAANTDGVPLVDVTYWKGGTPNALQSGRVDSYTGAMASAVITGSAFAGGAITSGAFAANAITATVVADGTIDRATFAADTGLQTVRSNTAQSGSTSTTIKLDASASATNNFYTGMAVYLTGGTGAGQVGAIIGYDGTTKVATIAGSWLVTPDNTTTFAVKPAVYGSNTIIFV